MSDYHFDAVIFDLDGVITHTASLHSQAWKEMFDEYLRVYCEETDTPFREFTHEEDYLTYVDGKPRYKGVESFLASRGIDLPFGDPSDPPGMDTVCALGNRKNELFNELIEEGKVEVFDTTVDFIRELRAAGIKIGVASSSKNAKKVLEAVGLIDLIETRVDGVVSAELGLKGKPAPDIFQTACDRLDVFYDRAVIVEDAISGVKAGQNGGFGLVIGVAREDNVIELKLNGGDIVVEDMAEINMGDIESWLTKRLVEEQWSISYYDYHPGREPKREALLTVGNGYFGTRGALEETDANEINYPGTYIAGLYNRLDSEVGGRIVTNEDFVNCPNWLPITFRIEDGDWFDLNDPEIEITHITRRLDFKTGVLRRSLVVRDKQGHETRVVSRRFASMDDYHVGAIRYRIIPLNYDKDVTVRSALDGDIINDGVKRYRQLNQKHLLPVKEISKGNISHLLVKTSQSNILIAESSRLLVGINGREIKPDFDVETSPGKVETTFDVDAQRGVAITVDKLVCIYASHQEDIDDPLALSQECIAKKYFFDELLQASTAAWQDVWEKIDIQVKGDRTGQKLIRLHLYHTLVTASPHNKHLDAGIPARGLHGEAYRGHIFWDELYILPFLGLHYPEIVQSALMYRYRRLPAAQKYAHEHGYQGAMFPWQSGSDGSEETPVLHLNPRSGEWGPDYSSLQRHVNLAIAYNVWQYDWLTEDQEFLDHYGARLFMEICRFWSSKARFNDEKGVYEIKRVMGPDEFHEKYPDATEGGLNNNSYTNIMVVWALRRAFDLLDRMSTGARDALRETMKLTNDEIVRWEAIASKLAVPLSDEGIIEQFDGYFDLKELDWEHYQREYDDIHRMDRILKAEEKSPDAYKVAKQADVLMTFYLLKNEKVVSILKELGYQVPDTLLRENFYYYLNRTSHGSTLSRLVHAYLANEIGDGDLSWKLYTEALKSDYIDIQGGTTKEGIHMGVMTGTVLFALRAYAGVNFGGECLKIDPNLPDFWRQMRFNIGFKGNRYYFRVTKKQVEIMLEGESPEVVYIQGGGVSLTPGEWSVVEID